MSWSQRPVPVFDSRTLCLHFLLIQIFFLNVLKLFGLSLYIYQLIKTFLLEPEVCRVKLHLTESLTIPSSILHLSLCPTLTLTLCFCLISSDFGSSHHSWPPTLPARLQLLRLQCHLQTLWPIETFSFHFLLLGQKHIFKVFQNKRLDLFMRCRNKTRLAQSCQQSG